MKLRYYNDEDEFVKETDSIADFLEYKSALILNREDYTITKYTYEIDPDSEYQDVFCLLHDILKKAGIDVYCVSEKYSWDDTYEITRGFFLVKDGIIEKFINYVYAKGFVEGYSLGIKDKTI